MKLPRSCVLFLGLGLGLAALACGKSKKLRPDTVPPGPVRDLTATVLGSDTVRLFWTAPGDDGNSGKAAVYDARRSMSPITSENFAHADTLGSAPSPGPAGISQQLIVTDLPGSSTHYLAIRAADEEGNWSEISALGPIHTLADTIPPATVVDLRILSKTDTSVTFAWTATGDDEHRGQISRYEFRYLGGVLSAASWSTAHQAHLSSMDPYPPGTLQAISIGQLPSRVSIHVALRALDESGNQSAISNPVGLVLRGAPKTWFIRTDGGGAAPTIQAGIDSSMDGDTLLIAPGRFFENIRLAGKSISLVSKHGAVQTIIDGSTSRAAVITLQSTVPAECRLEGFTITGGTGAIDGVESKRSGGGIFSSGYSPHIVHNVIEGNTANTYGGGISLRLSTELKTGSPEVAENIIKNNYCSRNVGGALIASSDVSISRNRFESNRAEFDAGGLFLGCDAGTCAVSGNTFIGNVAGDHGGGLVINGIGRATRVLVNGNLFANNLALGADVFDSGSGGAMWLVYLSGTVSSNTIVFNTGRGESAASIGGILLQETTNELVVELNIVAGNVGGGIGCFLGPASKVRNNLLWQNDEGDLGGGLRVCPNDWESLQLFQDPLFCDPAGGNFAVADSSPAVTGKEVFGAIREPGCR